MMARISTLFDRVRQWRDLTGHEPKRLSLQYFHRVVKQCGMLIQAVNCRWQSSLYVTESLKALHIKVVMAKRLYVMARPGQYRYVS